MKDFINNVNLWRAISLALAITVVLNLFVIADFNKTKVTILETAVQTEKNTQEINQIVSFIQQSIQASQPNK